MTKDLETVAGDVRKVLTEARYIIAKRAMENPEHEWFCLGKTEDEAIDKLFIEAGWKKEVVEGEGNIREIRYIRPSTA